MGRKSLGIIIVLIFIYSPCIRAKPELRIQLGHLASVYAVSFSPDGMFAV